MTSEMIMNEVDLEALNQLSSGQAALMMVRIMNTSDLTFMHSLFKKETNADICNVLIDLINEEHETLTDAQLVEFMDHINNIRN